MNQLLPIAIDRGGDDPEDRQESVELIDGEPVIPLEVALRFLHRVQQTFPEWTGLNLPYDSRVDETCTDAYSRYAQFVRRCLGIATDAKYDDMTERERERYFAYTLQGMPDFGFWSEPIPNPDELRTKYPEGSYPRHLLELDLAIVRVKVKKALQIVFNRAFGPLDHGEDPEVLSAFREKFVAAMRMMGIYYEPIRIAVFGVEDGEIASAELIETGMPSPDDDQRILPPLLKGNSPSLI